MPCPRGKANPDENTKLRLFAASGGYCQNPNCLEPLFHDVSPKAIHIAEMAHVFAARDDGPRPNLSLTSAERGSFSNLILLCPTCHTKIDKAAEHYTDEVVLTWKRNHETKLGAAFGAVAYPDRKSARAAIEPLLLSNRTIFDLHGPNLGYRFNPESPQADVWQHKVVTSIIPNSRRLLAIADVNGRLMTGMEKQTVELFRQHLLDLEARHLSSSPDRVALQFPAQMCALFSETT